MYKSTIVVIMLAIVLIILITLQRILKEKRSGNKLSKKDITIIAIIATISVVVTLLTQFISRIISNPSSVTTVNPPIYANNQYDFDVVIVDNIRPCFDDLQICKEYFNNYLNTMPKSKTSSAEELANNQEATALIAKRQQIDDLKQQLKIAEDIYKIVPNNSSVVKSYAILQQDYAIELNSNQDFAAEDMFLQAISTNFRLLSLTGTYINESDVCYRIGQCFEYLSLIKSEQSTRNHYQDSVSAIVFYQFAYESVDYEKSSHYGDPHAMSGIVAHHIAEKTDYNHAWCKFAESEYETALNELSPKSKYHAICVKGKADISEQLPTESLTTQQ